MVEREDHGSSARRVELVFEPSETSRTELTPFVGFGERIEPDQQDIAQLDCEVQEGGILARAKARYQKRAERRAAVVVAGNGEDRHRQAGELASDDFILLLLPLVGEIAREDHRIRRRIERPQGVDAAREGGSSVNEAIGFAVSCGDVGVGDMREQHGPNAPCRFNGLFA